MCNFLLFHIIITNVKEGSRWQYNRHFFLIRWHFTFNGVLPTRVNLCHYETILPSLSLPTILPCVLDYPVNYYSIGTLFNNIICSQIYVVILFLFWHSFRHNFLLYL